MRRPRSSTSQRRRRSVTVSVISAPTCVTSKRQPPSHSARRAREGAGAADRLPRLLDEVAAGGRRSRSVAAGRAEGEHDRVRPDARAVRCVTRAGVRPNVARHRRRRCAARSAAWRSARAVACAAAGGVRVRARRAGGARPMPGRRAALLRGRLRAARLRERVRRARGGGGAAGGGGGRRRRRRRRGRRRGLDRERYAGGGRNAGHAEVDGAGARRGLVVADVRLPAGSELAVEAAAPAAHAGVVEARAGVLAAGADRDGACDRRRDRPGRPSRVSRRHRCSRRSRTQLPAAALPPAAHAAVVEQRAGMAVAGRDRDRAAPGAEVHGAGCGWTLGVADALEVAVPQASVGAGAPAAHGAVVEHGAGVQPAGRDRDGGAAGAEVHRADQVGRLVVADVADAAVAELAVGAVSPAAHAAVVEHRARVRAAGRDRRCRAARPEPDRVDAARRLGVADRVAAAVAEPAVGVEAPAAHRAVVEHRARVRAARRQRLGRSHGPRSTGPAAAGGSSSPIVRLLA